MLGIPESFGTLLLTVAFVLSISPYFAGADFGVINIPQLDPPMVDTLKIAGPLTLLTVLGMFFPLWQQRSMASARDASSTYRRSARFRARHPQTGGIRSEFIRSPLLGIEVWQEGRRCSMVRTDNDYWASIEGTPIRVMLNPAPFEVRFANIGQADAVMITAWTDDSIFDLVRANVHRDHVPYFAQATGMADSSYGSGVLWLRRDAHHHLGEGRLVVRPDGSARVLYNTAQRPDGTAGFSSGEDIFLVVFLSSHNTPLLSAGSFERIILSFD